MLCFFGLSYLTSTKPLSQIPEKSPHFIQILHPTRARGSNISLPGSTW